MRPNDIPQGDYSDEKRYASRSGLKLAAAMDHFAIDASSLVCCDFGCNVGGFTDCLLSYGAAKVYAIDTGYGALAWKLRKDPRVVVLERTNALHADVAEAVDLISIDVAWTPQRLILPAAQRWLKPDGRVITLIKPHYELSSREGRRNHKGSKNHVLEPEKAREILDQTLEDCRQMNWQTLGAIQSPLVGSGGNLEYLALLQVG